MATTVEAVDQPRKLTVSGAPRKRVAAACSFCRGRKIRCSNERPTCSNCKTYNKVCEFEPVDDVEKSKSSPRPSRLQAKRKRTTAIHDRDETPLSASTASENKPLTGSATEAIQTTTPYNIDSQRTVSRIIVSPNGIPSYHGRTSALFEDNIQEQRTPDLVPLPQEWVSKVLFSEAAQQRQMEVLNLNKGKLDFDGVDPELGVHLLDLHWNRQHHSFLITYRPAFMRDMACNGPYFSKILLNAIYFGASKFSPRLEVRRDPTEVRTAGWKYRQRVRELLGGALDSSEITTIQALLIMAQSLFALGDERSAAWLYAGIAFRMLIDLGIHADTSAMQSSRLSDEDMEIRRRVFWAAFGRQANQFSIIADLLVVDKMQSLYQGRPVSLQESDTRVPITFLDTYEEYEHWKPFAYDPHARDAYPGSPAYSVSTFTSLCQLAVVMDGILHNIYAEATFDKSTEELSTLRDKLNTRLRKWLEQLPSHLKLEASKPPPIIPPPHVLSLVAMYNVLLILLHRPFVSDGHLHSNARSITVNSLLVCVNAATDIVKIIRMYHEAFSIRRAPYLIAYATYVSATIHIRIAAKRSPGSDAHRNLATCLEVFQINQETNWAARRAQTIVEGLARKLEIKLPDAIDTLSVALNDSQVAQSRQHQRDAGEQSSRQHADGNWQQGFSPTMDVDAIIQSFAREQDHPEVNTNIALGAFPPQERHHPGNGFFSAVPDYLGDNAGQDWLGTNDLSFDDLLFGFNNSMLDNLYAPPIQ